LQEVVKLRLTISKLESASMRKEMMGLTFVGWVLYDLRETISTDHLLLSDEAVRVMDTST